jgi:signal transduction histidine kinase
VPTTTRSRFRLRLLIGVLLPLLVMVCALVAHHLQHQAMLLRLLEVEPDVDMVAELARRSLAASLAIGAAGFVFAAGIGVLLTRRITGPVRKLAAAVKRIENGDLAVDKDLDIRSGDELELLATGLANMAKALHERHQQTSAIMERIVQMDHLKAGLLSSISHELRTPVTSLVAYGEILATTSSLSTEEQAEFANILHAEALRLQRLIDQTMDMSRYATAGADVRRERTDLNELVENVVSAVSVESLEYRVRIEFAGDWPIVITDPDRLGRALLAVVENAVRFTRPGGTVRLRSTKGPEGRTAILVEDEGPGIPSTDKSSIFECFHQAGDVLVGKHKGIGLGLPIARACMRAVGGDVDIVSSSPCGSVFRLDLPKQRAADRVAGSHQGGAG